MNGRWSRLKPLEPLFPWLVYLRANNKYFRVFVAFNFLLAIHQVDLNQFRICYLKYKPCKSLDFIRPKKFCNSNIITLAVTFRSWTGYHTFKDLHSFQRCMSLQGIFWNLSVQIRLIGLGHIRVANKSVSQSSIKETSQLIDLYSGY